MTNLLRFYRSLSNDERLSLIVAIVCSLVIAAPWVYGLSHRPHHYAPDGLLSPLLFLFGAVVFVLLFWGMGASLEIAIPTLIASIVGWLFAVGVGSRVLYGLVPLCLLGCWLVKFVWWDSRRR